MRTKHLQNLFKAAFIISWVALAVTLLIAIGADTNPAVQQWGQQWGQKNTPILAASILVILLLDLAVMITLSITASKLDQRNQAPKRQSH